MVHSKAEIWKNKKYLKGNKMPTERRDIFRPERKKILSVANKQQTLHKYFEIFGTFEFGSFGSFYLLQALHVDIPLLKEHSQIVSKLQKSSKIEKFSVSGNF